MQTFYILLALILIVTILLGLMRIVRGPTAADRMLALQLFGTTGVATVLLLSRGLDRSGLLDVALVFAILAAIILIGFVQYYWKPEKGILNDNDD